jgi:catechol 2,3-dioxygenase-like lactoylglutathione lyase family enzyme
VEASPLRHVELESGLLVSAEYDALTQRLTVEFRSGKRYAYQAVPCQTFDDLLNAESRGRFFNEQIRDRFEFREVATAIVGIDHVQLGMPAGREDDARRFYASLLGIPEVPKPGDLAERGGVWFENSAVKLHLEVDPEFRPSKMAHPALRVRELSSLVERLRAFGVEVIDEPLQGYDRVYVTDPFGNRIELLEPVGLHPWAKQS